MKKLSHFYLLIAFFSVSFISCPIEPDPELTVPEVTLTLSKENPQTTVIINWTQANDAEGYSITRSFTRDGVTDYYSVYSGDANVFTFEDNTCESGVEYTYIVYAYADKLALVDYIHFSEKSEPKTITTERKPLQTLDYPKNFTVSDAQENTNALTLKWDAVEGADTYEIYRCWDYSSEIKLIDTTNETSYTVYHLCNEKNYSFKLKAINGDKYSLFSAKKSCRVAEAENIIKNKAFFLENGITENFYSSNSTLWFKCTPHQGIITIFDTKQKLLRDMSATIFTEDGKVLATGLIFTLTESSNYNNAQVTFNASNGFTSGAAYYISLTHNNEYDISICVE